MHWRAFLHENLRSVGRVGGILGIDAARPFVRVKRPVHLWDWKVNQQDTMDSQAHAYNSLYKDGFLYPHEGPFHNMNNSSQYAVDDPFAPSFHATETPLPPPTPSQAASEFDYAEPPPGEEECIYSNWKRREATERERVQMHTVRYYAGWEYSRIAEFFPFNISTISRICGQPMTPKKRVGRPPKLRTPDRRRLVQAATINPERRRMPHTEAAHHANISACHDILKAAFKKEGYNRRVGRKKIFLDQRKKNLRLAWALERQHWTIEDWRHVIWTDECYVWLSRPAGRIWVTRKPGEALHEDCLIAKFAKSGTVMIWGGICGINGGTKLSLVMWDRDSWGTISSTTYINHVLTPVIIPWWYVHSMQAYQPIYVMEDGASSHTARQTQWFRSQVGLISLPWCPSSPDLNPNENIWGKIKKKLNALRVRPKKQDEVRAAIDDAWDSITFEEILELIDSMPARVQAVIAAQGGHIDW